MGQCVDLINQTLDGVEGVDAGLYRCHAHFDHKHGTEGPYEPIMPALAKVNLNGAHDPSRRGLSVAGSNRRECAIGLRLHDHCDLQMETPTDVLARVEGAMRYGTKNAFTLHPNCGFSPSIQNPMDIDEAYLKLKSMCQAAVLLRERRLTNPEGRMK